tara:strand:- start:1073822 stop:1074325 length:504 start_codon:yes stop_codon:yes gene_type:complete
MRRDLAQLAQEQHVRYRGGTVRCGVTMIEAILVVLILSGAAIASSFVLDSNWVANRTVRYLTIDVSQTLDLARNTAIANRCTVRVRRTRVNNVEQLEITEAAGPFRGEQRGIVVLGDEIRLRVRPSEIVFAADGTVSRAATWTVTQGRVAGQIVVTPTTGQVTVRLP